jgi:hypothetical protein
MNKILRVLLLTGLILAMVVPLTVVAERPLLTISGKVFNGANGGPEGSVTVRLWRDTGNGDVLVRQSDTKSAMGDFLFQLNCVQGYYTVEISAFMEGGADAVGMGWYAEYPGEPRILVKKEAGDPGPWTLRFYINCDNMLAASKLSWWANLVLEYSSVAGPRANAGWMYVSGKVFDAATAYGALGAQGATVMVCRPAFDEVTNTITFDPSNLPGTTTMCRAVTTSDRGFWGMGLARKPGMYVVWMIPPGGYTYAGSSWLAFQVSDVYGNGSGQAHGTGSAWLPWNFSSSEWIYNNMNFAVRKSDR